MARSKTINLSLKIVLSIFFFTVYNFSYSQTDVCEGTAFLTGNNLTIGDSELVGSIRICLDENNIGDGACMGTSEGIRIEDSDGNFIVRWTDATAVGTCLTLETTDGLANLNLNCFSGDATISWETVDEDGNNICVYGCNDPEADNYDPDANMNDGSCIYTYPGGGSDNCPTATPLDFEDGVACLTGDNSTASSSLTVSNCNPDPVNELWFQYTVEGTNNNFDFVSKGLEDVVIRIYSGCDTDELDWCESATGADNLNFSLGYDIGDQVWISVASNSLTDGEFNLCVTSAPPDPGAGNTCEEAIPTCEDGVYEIDQSLQSSSGVQPSCFSGPGSGPANQDTWFQFTVLETGLFEWEATPTGISEGVELDWALYDVTDGCVGDGAVEVNCNYEYEGADNYPNGQIVGEGGESGYDEPDELIAGQTYAILIDYYRATSVGTLTFEILESSTAVITPQVDFSISPVGVTCADEVTVEITDNSSGDPTYTFGNGTTYTGNDPPDQTYTESGVYAITAFIEDENCPSSQTEYVELFKPLEVTSSFNSESCPDECDASIAVTPNEGSGDYTYVWDHDASLTSPSISGLCAGDYSVTVTDAVCPNDVVVDISIPETTSCCDMVVNAGETDTVCVESSIVLNGSYSDQVDPIETIEWTSSPIAAAGNLDDPNIINPTFTPTEAYGTVTFTLSVTDDVCTQSDVVEIVVTPILQSITCPIPPDDLCDILEYPAFDYYQQFIDAGGSVDIDPAGAIDTTSFTLVSEDTDNGSCPETVTRVYSLTDSCGVVEECTQAIIIHDEEAPEITGTLAVEEIEGCDATDAPAVETDVAGLEALGLAISDNCTADADLNVTSSDAAPTGTCPMTIIRTYTVTDECGNSTDIDQTIEIDDTTPPSGDAPANTTVDCIDDVPAVNTADVTNLSDNCTAAGDLEVTHVSDVSNDQVCNNEEIERTYRITDECANTFDVSQTITISAVSPTFTVAGTDPTVCGEEDGFITISDLDANADYEFSYDDEATISITTNADGEYVIENLGAGTYSDFSVALANCTTCETIDNTSISLSDPNPPVFVVEFGSHPTTCGGTDGTILIDGDGTLDPNTEYQLSYVHDGNNVGPITVETDADGNYTIGDLSEGEYTNFSLSLDGCSGSEPGPITLEDPEAPVAEASTTTAEICVGDDILLFAEAVAGATYSWTGPNGYTSSDQNPVIENATIDNSGDYTLVVTTNNCPSDPVDVTVTVTEYPDLQITDPDAVCTPNTVDITAADVTAGSSNSDNLTYWEDADTTTTLNNADAIDASGIYYIKADNNGCAVVEEVEVLIIETPTYTLSGQDPSICNAADGSITISGLDNNESYDVSYSDDGGATTTDITENSDGNGDIVIEDLLAGDYEVTVTLTLSGTSCEGEVENVTLINPGAPQIDSFESVVACDVYTVPAITGSNLTGDETYYDQSGGPTEGNEVPVGTEITSSTTLYAYDADGDCSDEEVLVITVNNTPTISGPSTIEGCESVEMPPIEGDDLNDPAYYTEANGQGERIDEGETVTYEDFDNYPTTLYIYDETGTNPNCSSGEEVTLIIFELPTATILNAGDEYCEYDTPDNITVAVTGSPEWIIEYTINGITETVTSSESPITLDNSEGNYELVSISDENCTAAANGSAAIVYIPTPSAPNAGQDATYCSTVQLENMFADPSNDGEINWYLDDLLEDHYQSGEQIIPQLTIGETTYYVTETVNGCEGDYAEVYITIEDCEIIIPTAITPDGDGNNDVWHIPSLDEAYPNNTVRIYNRWGNQIFEHDSSTQGPYNEKPWDGSFKGDRLPVGSYFFIIEFNDGERGSENGAISIILD